MKLAKKPTNVCMLTVMRVQADAAMLLQEDGGLQGVCTVTMLPDAC